jgi:lipopolysaccharide/colanic/teichoic acid biosynthesis glycosyltransferase
MKMGQNEKPNHMPDEVLINQEIKIGIKNLLNKTSTLLYFLAPVLSFSILFGFLSVLLRLRYGWLIFFALYFLGLLFLFALPYFKYLTKVGIFSEKIFYSLLMKRLIDLPSALLVLFILSPVYLLISILIKFESPGPAIYKSKRIGLNCHMFDIYKFRTHYLASDLPSAGETSTKMGRTPLGKLLHDTWISELPQVYNVLIGDMSFIGPMAITVDEMKDLRPDQYRRFSFPPGISGLYQLSNTKDSSFQEMIDLDLSYIDNWSLLNDIKIILNTLLVATYPL